MSTENSLLEYYEKQNLCSFHFSDNIIHGYIICLHSDFVIIEQLVGTKFNHYRLIPIEWIGSIERDHFTKKLDKKLSKLAKNNNIGVPFPIKLKSLKTALKSISERLSLLYIVWKDETVLIQTLGKVEKVSKTYLTIIPDRQTTEVTISYDSIKYVGFGDKFIKLFE
jgi:hypothetical protein